MINKIQKEILSLLIDKYERSSFFKEDKIPSRRILLNFYDGGRSDFKGYDIENSEKRMFVNRSVKELSKNELLYFDWMKGERNHIIAKVWLNIDKLESVYELIGRKAKSDIVDEVCEELLSMHDQVLLEWIKSFYDEAFNEIYQKRKIVGHIPEDKKERLLIYKALNGIDTIIDNTEITERLFSLRCFGDSKIFEKTTRARIIRILKKYVEVDLDSSDEDILRQVGIVKYPEQFEFCGKVSFRIHENKVDFSHLRYGSSISISDLERGELVVDPSIKRVLTIENKANYIEYIKNNIKYDEIVLYHAGHYSPSKKLFFIAVKNKMPDECIWEHWGDIDYGGFSMLARLRSEIWSEIKPYRMDKTDIIKYKELAAPVSNEYTKKLILLLEKKELKDCYDCLEYLIENQIRLEQEAMLSDLE